MKMLFHTITIIMMYSDYGLNAQPQQITPVHEML